MTGFESTSPLSLQQGVVQVHRHMLTIVNLQATRTDSYRLQNHIVRCHMFLSTHVLKICW